MRTKNSKNTGRKRKHFFGVNFIKSSENKSKDGKRIKNAREKFSTFSTFESVDNSRKNASQPQNA